MKPDDASLRSLYVDQKLTYDEIASRYGVTKTTVSRWLRAAGISARSKAEQRQLAKKHVYSDETLARMRERAGRMRAKITPESIEKHRQKMLGRTPHNKGKPWTPEERAKHMAIRRTPEYKANLAASLSGEKNYMWKGGVATRSPAGWQWREIRQQVYERDNWTCRHCGCKCLNTADSKNHPKRKIQAHHVTPRRCGGTDDLSNLVTLCMSCHHKEERRFHEHLRS